MIEAAVPNRYVQLSTLHSLTSSKLTVCKLLAKSLHTIVLLIRGSFNK